MCHWGCCIDHDHQIANAQHVRSVVEITTAIDRGNVVRARGVNSELEVVAVRELRKI